MKKKFILLTGILTLGISAFLFVILSSKEKEKNAGVLRSESWAALQFLNDSRAYPFADIPADAYPKAERFYKTHFENHSARTTEVQTSAWQSIGPNNIGGRTLAVALDPTDTAVVWIGAASGGLWKSITGGIGTNAWTHIPTGFPVRGVTSIAINPSNHNEIYIGTGETHTYATAVNGLIQRPTRGSVGIGILKTTDGGATWTHSLNWSYNTLRGVWDFKINPLNPNIVYAATTEGVYKTTDAGATWNLSLNQLMVMDLEMDKVDTNIVYAGVGNGDSPNKGIYKTSNSGAAWTVLTNGLPPNTHTGRITITAYPANNNRIMAVIANLYSTAGVYESTNKGASWVARNTLPFTEILSYQGWYCEGLCYKNNNPTHILFGGVQVFLSQSSGDLLFRVSNNGNPGDEIHADIHDIISNPLDPNKIYFATDGGLYRSDDFGNTYYACTEGYVTTQFYIGSASRQDGNLLLGGLQDNYSVQFTGTNYWFPVLGGDGSFNAIHPTNDLVQYASYQYLNVFKTTNNWSGLFQIYNHSANASTYNNVAFIAPFILCPSNPQVLYAATEELFRSNNGGSNWFPTGNIISAVGEPVIALAVSATNVDSVFASTAPSDTQQNHLWRSSDGGQTFTDITGTLPDRFMRDIALNPNNSQEVFVALSGFGAGHLFKSLNAGNTWTDVSTALPDVPFHCVIHDPTNTNRIFAGSDLGVFTSIDGGLTWTAFNANMPNGAMVFDLVYSPADTSLVAFTHGYGAYKISVADFSVSTEENSFVTAFTQDVLLNPCKDFIQLMINSGTEGTAEFFLYDIKGKSISLKKQHLHSGVNGVTVDVRNFSPGFYFVRTRLGKESKVSKVMIE